VEDGGGGLTEAEAVKRIAEELDVSAVTVSVNLPYMDVVYNLPEPSANAKRCRRWKERKVTKLRNESTGEVCQPEEDWSLWLWKKVIEHEGKTFATSGRGQRPGVSFSYTVSPSGGAGGRHYEGAEVEGYGNELWVTTNPNSPDTRKLKKSISRSTVELGYKRTREMDGMVPGPKALGIPGAGSYVFILLREFGVIKE
jgi:hypothetical protein